MIQCVILLSKCITHSILKLIHFSYFAKWNKYKTHTHNMKPQYFEIILTIFLSSSTISAIEKPFNYSCKLQKPEEFSKFLHTLLITCEIAIQYFLFHFTFDFKKKNVNILTSRIALSSFSSFLTHKSLNFFYFNAYFNEPLRTIIIFVKIELQLKWKWEK